MPRYPFIGLILAAGYATRMPSNKLLLPWHGKALVRHVADHAKSLGLVAIFTVVRSCIEHEPNTQITKLLQDTRLIRTRNAHKGMGASLADGIRELMQYLPPDKLPKSLLGNLPNSSPSILPTTLLPCISSEVSGVMVFLGDMPAICKETSHDLCQTALKEPDFPHAPVYNGIQGHPVIIPRHLWPLLATLENDTGAKKLLQEQGLRLMPTHDTYVCMDIDTPEAYQALLHLEAPI